MSHAVLPLPKLHLSRDRVLQALRPHSRPLLLACGLAGALLVWSFPAASEGRCMIARRAAFGWQGAIALSIALTALGWYAHKPALQRLGALARRFRPAR